MDTNNDGQITFEEAQAARPELTRDEFKARDFNGDGFWTSDDRILGYRTMAGRRRMEEVDKNSDGKVTLDEFMAACQEEFTTLDANADKGISSDEWPRRGPGGGPGFLGARPWGPSPDDPNRMQPMGPPLGGPPEGGPRPFGPEGMPPTGPQPGESMGGELRIGDASGTQG